MWVNDITYIPTDEGWLYLASVTDLYSRKIVGWAMDKTMTKELVISALKMAYKSQEKESSITRTGVFNMHLMSIKIYLKNTK
ncbi:MAG: DDE-type integrase/transposase/recombinase [Epulopiscium sp.]|nr:DDE-type integrase/transposase/recombinase [Candidatus Epulonipiscium sp.]